MKRTLLVLGSLLFLIISGLIIAPSFIDLNQYKSEISAKIEEATGYKVEIAGNIGAALIPSPQAKIEGLSVSVPGEKDTLITLKQANVAVELAPLLQKRVSVDEVTLINPVITIAKRADGSMSWMTSKIEAMTQKGADAGKAKSGQELDVAFNRISIENGAITYKDLAAGQTHAISKLNASLAAKSLKGPFAVKGQAVYGEQQMSFEVQTQGTLDDSGAIPVQMQVGIPQGDTSIQFGGVIDTKAMEVQGDTQIMTSNLQAAGTAAKMALPASLKQKMSIQGTLTAGQEAASFAPIKLALGDFEADGSLKVSGIQDKAPMMFDLVMDSDDVLSIDSLMGAKSMAESSAAQKGGNGAISSPVPQTLQLPFDIAGEGRFSLAGVQMGGQLYQGVTAAVSKSGKTVEGAAKVQKAPGDMSLDSGMTLTYASASKSSNGAVTLADPSLTLGAKGKIASISKLANAYNIQLSDQAKAIGSAGFDISANLENNRIVLNDSSLKLDETNAAVAGYFKPVSGGRNQIGIDVSADTVNFDKFIPSKGKAADSAAAPANLEQSLEGVKKFSLPFDADFDISIQEATYQGQKISGLRLEGTMDAKTLTLKQAGVQSYLGTSVTAKGGVADVPNLSGIDLDIYARTTNVQSLLSGLKANVEGLPANIGAAEANVSAKGSLQSMTFSSNVKALQGELAAKGTAAGILSKPQLSDMEVGILHPNFVKAMQILNPAFKAGSGLEQKFDIYAKVDQSGDVYTLSGIKGAFGPMSINGDIKAVMGGGKPSIDGVIALGTVPLDTFLGSDRAVAVRGGKQTESAAQSSERWSTRPLDVSWMDNANINLAVQAKGVNYGAWAFTQPQTSIIMDASGLKIKELTSGLFGGEALVNVDMKPNGNNGLGVSLSSAMTNVGVESLVYAMSNSNKLKASGNVSLLMDVNASGGSANALVNSLGGKANLEGREVIMEGFDLGRLAKSLSADIKPGDSVQALTSGVRGGTTEIDTIDGDYAIQSGIVTITSMVMDGPDATINSRGNVSLPKWYIDTTHQIVLKGAAEDVPAFEIAIKGPLDNPGNTFGKGILQDYLQRKIQRKLAKEAEKFLGDKVDGQLGGVINQILGGGSGTQSAPQEQAPAAGAESVEPQPAQPQQQQKAPAQSQEEQLIRGVLDGLLR